MAQLHDFHKGTSKTHGGIYKGGINLNGGIRKTSWKNKLSYEESGGLANLTGKNLPLVDKDA